MYYESSIESGSIDARRKDLRKSLCCKINYFYEMCSFVNEIDCSTDANLTLYSSQPSKLCAV